MHSPFNLSPIPYLTGGLFLKSSYKNGNSFAKFQFPLSSNIDFNRSTSTLTISSKGYRLSVRNLVNKDTEAQISQEKEDTGNRGKSGPSTREDPSADRNYLLEEVTSSLSTLARFPWGSRSLFDGLNNQQREDTPLHLRLYEFEACPFCRRVREAITELDLSAEIFPCPKGSVRHREMVRQLGGREQFPFLVDPNTGTSMYESTICGNRSPSFGILESTLLTGWMPTILRAGRGMALWEKSRKEPPPGKLELFSYENSAYTRIVREVLCELELPYVLQTVSQGSLREKLLYELSGSKEVPYLVDHNTGMKTNNYKKIVSYLCETYSSKSTPGYV